MSLEVGHAAHTAQPRHQSDDFMARIAAEHLADHLARSGFVVSKGPPSGDFAHLDVRPPIAKA